MLTLDGGLILSEGGSQMTRVIGPELPLRYYQCCGTTLQEPSFTCRDSPVSLRFLDAHFSTALVMVINTLSIQKVQSYIDEAVHTSLITMLSYLDHSS